MEFIIDRNLILAALLDVSLAVSTKDTIPILKGIKMEVFDDKIILTGGNQVSIIKKIIKGPAVSIIQTGSTVLEARFLVGLVRKLENDLHVKSISGSIVVRSGEVETTFHGMDPAEYPKLHDSEAGSEMVLTIEKLKEIILQTGFAAAINDARPVLTGCHWRFKNRILTCAATDSQRMAMRKIDIESDLNRVANIPTASLSKLLKLLPKQAGNVNIQISDSFILFKTPDFELYSLLITGSYPQIDRLIPTGISTEITLNRKTLENALDRMNIISNHHKHHDVRLSICNGEVIELSTIAYELGKMVQKIMPNEIQGKKELDITFDSIFMLEAVKSIQDAQLKLSFYGENKPIVVESTAGNDQLSLISSVRTK
ncbi:DNA polymerase III subunit beta [Falsibacillus albus]|nr:DNA polymerase III subunit beta [Falsibacillus albus]